MLLRTPNLQLSLIYSLRRKQNCGHKFSTTVHRQPARSTKEGNINLNTFKLTAKPSGSDRVNPQTNPDNKLVILVVSSQSQQKSFLSASFIVILLSYCTKEIARRTWASERLEAKWLLFSTAFRQPRTMLSAPYLREFHNFSIRYADKRQPGRNVCRFHFVTHRMSLIADKARRQPGDFRRSSRAR